MMPRPVPVMSGQVVTLRALRPAEDAQDYYEICLEPEVHTWTGNRVLASVEEARAELERLAGRAELMMWGIVDNASGRLVGRFFICLQERDGRLVVGEGNRIARPFWRKGHNREARRLIFEYVFEVLGADWIETECWTANENSRLSILAHGFEPAGETEAMNEKHGCVMGKSRFCLTRQRWRSRYQEYNASDAKEHVDG